MTVEEHAAILAEILANPSDTATVSEKLTILSENYGSIVAEKAAADLMVAELTEKNEKLIQQNMELFLKVGNVPESAPPEQGETIPTYDDLFDENGNLK